MKDKNQICCRLTHMGNLIYDRGNILIYLGGRIDYSINASWTNDSHMEK